MGSSPGSPERLAVVSGHYPGSVFASSDNHRIYCDRHGYTYISCNWPTRATNPYFNKFEFIRHYLSLFDVVFWLDDDAFFIDFDRSLDEFLPPPGHILSMCSSPDFKAISTKVSSGQFALRCDELGREFVDDVLQTDLETVERWWPEDGGFYTKGDQDVVVYLLETQQRYARAVTVHHYSAFNSRIENLMGDHRHPVFLLHFTGPPERKRRDWKRARRALGRGPGLVPRVAEVGWALRPEPTLVWRARSMASSSKRRVRRIVTDISARGTRAVASGAGTTSSDERSTQVGD